MVERPPTALGFMVHIPPVLGNERAENSALESEGAGRWL